tara:strand:- start:663 stop:764 length:102 start_codon:yes stop_codon:yes gene_type:complete
MERLMAVVAWVTSSLKCLEEEVVEEDVLNQRSR